MRFLLISLIAQLLLQACSRSTTKGLLKQEPTTATVHNSYFSQLDVDYIYKMNISYLEHVFGGLLVVKKIDEHQHRVVMLGEMGNKFLDLTIAPGKTVKNFAIAELDKPLLIKVLAADLAMMVNEHVPALKEFASDEQIIVHSRQGAGNRYLFFAQPGGDLKRIVRRNFGKERVDLQFTKRTAGTASHITITHLTRPLTIVLDRIHN